MATSAERRRVRRTLIDLGYVPGPATHDSGDGRYGEMWTLGDTHNSLVLSWAPRTEEPEVSFPVPDWASVAQVRTEALDALLMEVSTGERSAADLVDAAADLVTEWKKT